MIKYFKDIRHGESLDELSTHDRVCIPAIPCEVRPPLLQRVGLAATGMPSDSALNSFAARAHPKAHHIHFPPHFLAQSDVVLIDNSGCHGFFGGMMPHELPRAPLPFTNLSAAAASTHPAGGGVVLRSLPSTRC